MIEVVDYDPRWPQQFAMLRNALAAALGALALAIEHVGSTAVPGLAAKPILDVDVVIASRDRLPDVIAALGVLGYEYQGDGGIAGREAFRRPDNSPTLPRHHLYACPQDGAELARHRTLRDFLRRHPAEAAAYGDLKRELARRFPDDINAYVAGKGAFIEGALDAAQIR